MDEMKTAKAENNSGMSDLTLENMTGQLSLMHKQLLELRLEDVLGEETIHTMTDPQAAARKKLLSQLEQLKAVGVGGSSKTESNSPTYSLYIKQSTSALEEGAMLSTLSSRLAVLEAAVGFSADQMSILTMETGKKNISQAVQVLSSKTTLMDPSKLDHIEGQSQLNHQSWFSFILLQEGWELYSRNLVIYRSQSRAWTGRTRGSFVVKCFYLRSLLMR